MTITRRVTTLGGLGLLAASSFASRVSAGWDAPIANFVEDTEEFSIASDAYIYGYPLVTMEMTRRVITNVAAPEGTRAPMGQLIRMRQYPDASFRDVTAPNADTLYVTAFADVSNEPWVLSIPDMKDRYYLMPMLDGWTNVFEVPGKRTTGTGPQTYAITGPQWTGKLPDGVAEYKSPTGIVWILGRLYCTGAPEDYAAVHALQDEIKLVPLSSYGRPYTPPVGAVDPSIDMKTPVRDQVNALSATEFFTILAQLLKANPPAAADAPAVAQFAGIGLVPGQDFAAGKFDPISEKRIPKFSMDRILLHSKESSDMQNINGWSFTTKTGLYGTDYLQRALITVIGLGANRPQDAVYPVSQKEGEALFARSYNGSSQYIIHFAKGQMPPAKGFWSLTMYDDKYFFVANPLNRYSISERQDLKRNADGSVDIYIQHATPGAEKESNWLPAPAGNFVLMLRLYWPDESDPSILNGSWIIPPVTRAA